MIKIIFKKHNIARLKLAFIAWSVVVFCFIYLKEFNLIESSYTLFGSYSLLYWIIQITNLFIREKREKSKIPLFLVHLSGLTLFFVLMNYRWLFIPVLVYMFPLYITMSKKEYTKITIFSYIPLIIFSFIDYFFITKKYLKDDILILAISGLMTLIFRQSNKVYNYQKEQIEEKNRELEGKNRILREQRELIRHKNRELMLKNRIMEEELQIAKNIQESIIPTDKIEDKNIKIVSIYKPIEDLGGDFFDIIKTDRGYLFFVSDVSGHGIPAALITVMIKAYIDSTPTFIKEDPKRLLEELNKKVIDKTNNNFITVFACFYNKYLHKLTYVKAGHNSPILIKNNKIITLESRGKFLGVFENINLEEKEIYLEKDDKLIIFTDGLIEMSKDDKLFEDEFFLILQENKNSDIEDIFKTIKNRCEECKECMNDDICIVGFQIL